MITQLKQETTAPQRIITELVGEYSRLTHVGKLYAFEGNIPEAERVFFEADQLKKMAAALGIRLEKVKVDQRYTEAYKDQKLLLTFDGRSNRAKVNKMAGWRFQ